MTKNLILFILFVLTVRAQESVKITFRIEANNIPDSAKLYITGNTKELGRWDPAEVSLINTSSNFWERTFIFPEGTELEYKITLGSWSTEAVNENGSIPGNGKLDVKSDTTIDTVINHWKQQFKYQSQGHVTGKIDYYRDVKGKGILPRDILVWLPPGYKTDINKRYPVLYMQDGQNLFDPAASAFGVDWQIDETADSLIRKGKMRSIIIVGLTNTKWRSSEYADNDTGYAYMRFVVNKVKPFIDSAYRTLSDAENTAVGGSSLGALITFMLGWNYPHVFSKVICMSPALKISKINYVKNVEQYTGPRKNLKFYFDAGSGSLDSLLIPGTVEMINALEKQGYEYGVDILWYVDKQGKHNEASWSKRIWRPLLFFFGREN